MADYRGTSADDVYTGGDSDDWVVGEGGNDTLAGGGGADFVEGGAGDDLLSGNDGHDDLYGDVPGFSGVGGNDVIDGGDGNDFIVGGFGDDRIVGGTGDDSLYGELGNDTLIGGTGNDFMRGGAGLDYFDGGENVAGRTVGTFSLGDTVSFSDDRATQAVIADLRTGMVSNDGFGNVETMVGIESLGAGTAFADQYYGNHGVNSLSGGRGDTVMGLGGDDETFAVGAPALLDGGEGRDRLTLFTSGVLVPDNNGNGVAERLPDMTVGYTIDLAAETLVDGHGLSGTIRSVEAIVATHLADELRGSAADEWFAPGNGSDIVDGRGGVDTVSYARDPYDHYYRGDGGVFIDLAAGQAIETRVTPIVETGQGDVASPNTGTAGPGSAANSTDSLAGIENAVGSGLGDTIYGTEGDNRIAPGAGNDVIDGRGGIDTVDYSAARAAVEVRLDTGTVLEQGTGEAIYDPSGSTWLGTIVRADDHSATTDQLAGIENAVGSAFADILVGDAGANRLEGGDGDDIIEGGAGDDALAGGAGNDTLRGGAGTDRIEGGDGNDHLDGGEGVDEMIGGLGDDTYVLDEASEGVSELAGEGIDTILTPVSLVLPDEVENLTLIGNDIADANGNDLDNVLTGNDNINRLSGGAGADRMIGRGGDDSYIVEQEGDTVVEAIGEGYDTIAAFVSYALGDWVEELALLGTAAIDGTGNTLDNRLTGNSAANRLDGAAGADILRGMGGIDTLVGGLGNDVYLALWEDGTSFADTIVESEGEGVDEVRTDLSSFSLAGIAHVENLTGLSVSGQFLTGNDLGNRITGAVFSDTLQGGAGDDVLDGGAGADTMRGGSGNDSFRVDSMSDTVEELAGEGTDEVRTAIGSRSDMSQIYVLPANVENLTGTASTGQGVAGNALDNIIILSGGESDLILQGANDLVVLDAGGNDRVETGGGNDFIYFGGAFTSGDSVKGGSGTDTVGLLGTYSLTLEADDFAGIEKLALYSSGNAAAPNGYAITTHEGNVAAGATLQVVAQSLLAGETLVFNGAAETDGRFNVRGGRGDDTITGGAGADTIWGNLGADMLRGGKGGDFFEYRSAAESTAAARDTILDFASGDKIFLTNIDADGNAVAGNGKFAFIGGAAFSGKAGELRVSQDPNFSRAWFVEGDTDGDTVADFSLIVVAPNAYPLGKDDFFL